MLSEVISIKNLNFSYNKQSTVYSNLNLDIQSNKIIVLLGHNGAGKSTLIKLIVGLLSPTNGSITTGFKKMNYLPDDGGFSNALTVKENINLFNELLNNLDGTKVKELINKWGLQKVQNQLAFECSLGQRRRLSLALADLKDADIYLFDEPSGGVDIVTNEVIENFILDLKNKGKTVIVSTHDINLIEKIADEIIIINEGEVILNSSISNLDNIRETYKSILQSRGFYE